jgi:hypothetical protein
MKHLLKTCALALLLASPTYAQDATAPTTDAGKPAPQGMMMNCPMMGDTSAMQKDLGSMMGDVETMMKETNNGAQKERLQRMHAQMQAMMANMQKMGANGMMGNGMMGAQQPRAATPGNPETAPSTAPASPDDHESHHPAP